MKKKFLSLSAAFLLFAGASYAQDHSSSIDQDGSNHSAVVVQSLDSQTSDIEQDGSNHSADVSQIGQRNLSYIEQAGSNNLSGVSQSGKANSSSIDQAASNNTAYVTQTSAFYAEAEIDQFGGNNNMAQIQQVGIGEDSPNDVVRPGDFGLIQQNGNRNFARIEQGPTAGNSEGEQVENSSKIYQTGNDNEAFTSQYGQLNESLIRQTGNLNTATVTQSSEASYSGIWQNGNGNTATVTQTGGL